MSKLIALRSGYEDGMFNAWQRDFSSRLKQQALFFDQIGIFNLDKTLNNSVFTLLLSFDKTMSFQLFPRKARTFQTSQQSLLRHSGPRNARPGAVR